MKEVFYHNTIQRLLADGWLKADDQVLVVAGGLSDREVLSSVGLSAVTISNLDDRMRGDEFAPFQWSFQNAEELKYPDGSFDICVVHQGLHHCRSPHRAIVEMYRVARRGIVVLEPHETAVTRLGVKLGIGQKYECAAVLGRNDLGHGGVQNSDIPNYVYRLTQRDVYKTLAAYDPTGTPRVRCFYDLRGTGKRASQLRKPSARAIARIALPVGRLALRLVPSQANAIAVVADKLDPTVDLHPWLRADGHEIHPDEIWFERRQAGSSAS